MSNTTNMNTKNPVEELKNKYIEEKTKTMNVIEKIPIIKQYELIFDDTTKKWKIIEK
jgi:hypothetical protein